MELAVHPSLASLPGSVVLIITTYLRTGGFRYVWAHIYAHWLNNSWVLTIGCEYRPYVTPHLPRSKTRDKTRDQTPE